MRYDTRYRSFGSSGPVPTGVKWLLIANVVVFLLSSVAGEAIRDHLLMLSLVPVMVLKHFFLWQLATYMFLHAGIWHIVFNMLTLWWAGTPLEQDWGTRRFLKYYLLCGIGAGLCDVALNGIMGNWGTRTVGASGAVYGLLLAFGLLYPNAQVIFFIFPMKAKYMVMIVGAIAFYGALNVNSGVSDIAHLGGMAFGYLYLRGRFLRADLSFFQREYTAWKLRRAKKRFQVYLRKHGSDRDTFVN